MTSRVASNPSQESLSAKKEKTKGEEVMNMRIEKCAFWAARGDLDEMLRTRPHYHLSTVPTWSFSLVALLKRSALRGKDPTKHHSNSTQH